MKESKIESSIFKYKIGREEVDVDDFSQIDIEESIIINEFDVCRIKLFGGTKDQLENLNKLGYPYEIYTINYYNLLEIKNKPKVERENAFSIREVINPKSDQEFIEILEDVLENSEWIEYKSLLSNKLMPLNLRKELARDYYSSFSNNIISNTYTGVLNKDSIGIGIFLGQFKDNTFHGAIFGLKNEYKSKGYAKYFYDFMCEVCQKRGVTHFVDEVNIFNIPSQKSASSQNLVPHKIYFNISIFPFYDFKNKIYCEIILKEYNFSSIIMYLENLFSDYKVNKVNTKSVPNHPESKIDKLVKLCPVYEDSEIFFVFHFLSMNEIKHSYYIHLLK